MPKDLLDLIGKTTQKDTSQAIRWAEFFKEKQNQEEGVNEFINRCTQMATSCEFECPQCNSDIAEYVCVKKIMAGLSDVPLK